MLCDRFADSTRVYQGALGGLPPADVEALIRFATGGLEPDLTFLLDCDIEVALARLARARMDAATASSAMIMRSGISISACATPYLALAARHQGRFVRIAADQSADATLHAALSRMEARFGAL